MWYTWTLYQDYSKSAVIKTVKDRQIGHGTEWIYRHKYNLICGEDGTAE